MIEKVAMFLIQAWKILFRAFYNRKKLACVKGLNKIIVRAEVKTQNAVVNIGFCRQKQNGRVYAFLAFF